MSYLVGFLERNTALANEIAATPELARRMWEIARKKSKLGPVARLTPWDAELDVEQAALRQMVRRIMQQHGYGGEVSFAGHFGLVPPPVHVTLDNPSHAALLKLHGFTVIDEDVS